MTTDIRNPKAWEPVVASITSTEGARASMTDSLRATKYVEIVKQFDVEHNPRYVKGHDGNPNNGLETYCNIFDGDVMSALGVVAPHWIDPATGAPTPMGKGKETSANTLASWFAHHGFEYGWMECGEIQARKRATHGYPTTVVWNNPVGIGHVAVVLPGTDYTHIAQAGGVNFFDGNMRGGFGGITSLRFYTHD